MKFIKKFLPFLLVLYWFLGVQVKCIFHDLAPDTSLIPVYADSVKIHQITVESPRPMRNTGKIYYKDATIFVIERDSGIHVVDNRQPTDPKRIGFIKLQGCNDIAIKGANLYADNFTDLVVLDVSKPEQPQMVNRLPGIYPVTENGTPGKTYYGYYQCIDPAKGKVIAWKEATLDTTKCYKRQ